MDTSHDERLSPVLDRVHVRRERLSTLRRRLVEDAVVRGVMIPDRLPIEVTVRALHTPRAAGIHVGSIVVNRLLPQGADGDFLRARRDQQDSYLAETLAETDMLLAGERITHVAQQPRDVASPEALSLFRL